MTDQLIDPFDVRRAHGATGLLAAFNEAGVLGPADVHVAQRLGRLGRCDDEAVLLAAALAVRGPRVGHVTIDLATIRETAVVETDEPVDVAGLPWPALEPWIAALRASALAGEGDRVAPLRLEGTRLYLDRYWQEERGLAQDLLALARDADPAPDMALLRAGIGRLFGDDAGGRQAMAAATAVLRRLTVVAGGPGTGKTTAVARVVALLCEQALAAGERLPLVALAAPTGKAAARLAEAVHEEGAELDVQPAIRDHLAGLGATTIHKLLGWTPRNRSRFHHDRTNRLAHDVVIIDESSMVSLSLMARLLEAVAPGARVVLVGDPGQLRSVEAGAVLGDVVGPAATEPRLSAVARERLEAATGHAPSGEPAPSGPGPGDGIVVLDRVHRHGERIARIAEAIRGGDSDLAIERLRDGGAEVTWIEAADPAQAASSLRADAVTAGRRVAHAALAGDSAAALAALGSHRLLCAHRRGPYGVTTWAQHIVEWLMADTDGFEAAGRWYPGRPLLVTENDYELGLSNGDTGVVVRRSDDRLVAAFERAGETIEVAPSRLGSVETVYAMTIHKSQGSQFGTAVVLLPDAGSRILSRELLYTGVTRAQERLVVVGPEATLRAAIERPVARASGLRDRLWGELAG